MRVYRHKGQLLLSLFFLSDSVLLLKVVGSCCLWMVAGFCHDISCCYYVVVVDVVLCCVVMFAALLFCAL